MYLLEPGEEISVGALRLRLRKAVRHIRKRPNVRLSGDLRVPGKTRELSTRATIALADLALRVVAADDPELDKHLSSNEEVTTQLKRIAALANLRAYE